MNVTFVIASLSAGGAERVVSIMANYWAERSWNVTILSLDKGDPPPFFPLHGLVRLISLDLLEESANVILALWNNTRRILRLRRALLDTHPDVVVSFLDKTNVLTLLAMAATKIRVIVSERIDPSIYSIGRVWSFLRKWAYLLANRIVVQTPSVEKYFLSRFKKSLVVIPNPVLYPSHPPTASTIAGNRMILAIGRLSDQKGFTNLLQAYASVYQDHRDWLLTIVGDGPQRKHLQIQCQNLGISDRVSFPGVVKDVERYYQKAGLFVLSSHFEGFPNALCEAMACGIPAISTDCPSGPREIIHHGKSGLLVPPKDVKALAVAMECLMSDEQQRVRMGQAAVEITRRYSLEKIMGMWERLLKDAN